MCVTARRASCTPPVSAALTRVVHAAGRPSRPASSGAESGRRRSQRHAAQTATVRACGSFAAMLAHHRSPAARRQPCPHQDGSCHTAGGRRMSLSRRQMRWHRGTAHHPTKPARAQERVDLFSADRAKSTPGCAGRLADRDRAHCQRDSDSRSGSRFCIPVAVPREPEPQLCIHGGQHKLKPLLRRWTVLEARVHSWCGCTRAHALTESFANLQALRCAVSKPTDCWCCCCLAAPKMHLRNGCGCPVPVRGCRVPPRRLIHIDARGANLRAHTPQKPLACASPAGRAACRPAQARTSSVLCTASAADAPTTNAGRHWESVDCTARLCTKPVCAWARSNGERATQTQDAPTHLQPQRPDDKPSDEGGLAAARHTINKAHVQRLDVNLHRAPAMCIME